MSIAPAPKRGEVWLVSFDPAVGAEIRKVRPALVISLDWIGRLPLRIVAPLTDWKVQYGGYPWFVGLRATAANGLAKDFAVDAFQVKSVGLPRFSHRLGKVTVAQVDSVSKAVAYCVGGS